MAINFRDPKLIFGAGGAIAIGGVLYYRRKKSGAAATQAAAAPDPTDPTQDPNAIDPVTGLPYSEEQASDAYSAAYDSGVTGSPYASTSGLTWNPATGQWEAAPTNGDSTNPTTNAQWGTSANLYLAGLGDNPITAAEAIGKYLAGQGAALTPDELSVVQSAIGALGYPPTPVPGPSLAPSGGQTNPGSGVTGGTPAPGTAAAKAMSQAQVRAASPRVTALYEYYQAHPNAYTIKAYQNGVNQWRNGGEAHVDTVAQIQAADKAHGSQY